MTVSMPIPIPIPIGQSNAAKTAAATHRAAAAAAARPRKRNCAVRQSALHHGDRPNAPLVRRPDAQRSTTRGAPADLLDPRSASDRTRAWRRRSDPRAQHSRDHRPAAERADQLDIQASVESTPPHIPLRVDELRPPLRAPQCQCRPPKPQRGAVERPTDRTNEGARIQNLKSRSEHEARDYEHRTSGLMEPGDWIWLSNFRPRNASLSHSTTSPPSRAKLPQPQRAAPATP